MTEAEFLNALPTSVQIEGDFASNTARIDTFPLNLHRSLKVRNHSPTGFNWGYSGSGPAQFSLAILLEYVDAATACKYYQDLKFGWTSGLPRTDFIKTVNLRQIMTDILNKQNA